VEPRSKHQSNSLSINKKLAASQAGSRALSKHGTTYLTVRASLSARAFRIASSNATAGNPWPDEARAESTQLLFNATQGHIVSYVAGLNIRIEEP